MLVILKDRPYARQIGSFPATGSWVKNMINKNCHHSPPYSYGIQAKNISADCRYCKSSSIKTLMFFASQDLSPVSQLEPPWEGPWYHSPWDPSGKPKNQATQKTRCEPYQDFLRKDRCHSLLGLKLRKRCEYIYIHSVKLTYSHGTSITIYQERWGCSMAMLVCQRVYAPLEPQKKTYLEIFNPWK